MLNEVTATFTVGNNVLEAIALLGPDQGPPATGFSLFGASNDPNPRDDPGNEMASSATRPANDRLEGPSVYLEDETFTLQLVFQQGGRTNVFEVVLSAARAQPGQSWTGPMTRVVALARR